MTSAQIVVPISGNDELSQKASRDLKTLAYGGSVLLVASAFGNGLNYAFGIFLARTLGVEEFGLYGLGLTIFNILILTAVFGMDIGAVKFVSHHLGGGHLAKAQDSLVAAIIIALGSGLIVAIGLGLLASPLASTLYGKPELVFPLLFFAAAIPFATVGNVAISITQAFQTVRSTVIIKYLWEPSAKFFFAACLLWAGFQLPGVLFAVVVTFVISAVLSVRMVRHIAKDRGGRLWAWNVEEARTLLMYCVPLAISNLFGVVAPRSDVLILGYWASSGDVGVYVAAFQTASIISLVLGAFLTSLGPIISRAWSLQDHARLQESYQTVSRLSIMLSLPIFSWFILFANDILLIFGPEFTQGTVALLLLAIGQMFSSGTGSANTVLLMSGHSRLVMTNTVVMGLVLLAMTATIIPIWGITGAAAAASMTLILTNIIRAVQVWRLHHIQPYTWDLVKPIIAAGIAVGMTVVLHDSMLNLPWPLLGLAMGIFYLSGLLLLGVNQQDRVVFQSLLAGFKGPSGWKKGVV